MTKKVLFLIGILAAASLAAGQIPDFSDILGGTGLGDLIGGKGAQLCVFWNVGFVDLSSGD